MSNMDASTRTFYKGELKMKMRLLYLYSKFIHWLFMTLMDICEFLAEKHKEILKNTYEEYEKYERWENDKRRN